MIRACKANVEVGGFKASLDYIVRPCLKTAKKKKRKENQEV
jgi:hypothetical protein